jgi:hypothetical protein
MHHEIQHNDTQHNETQHKELQYNVLNCDAQQQQLVKMSSLS